MTGFVTPGNGRISGLIDGNAFSAENGNDIPVQRYLSVRLARMQDGANLHAVPTGSTRAVSARGVRAAIDIRAERFRYRLDRPVRKRKKRT